MNATKKVMALLLVFALAVSCLPLGAVAAFATEIDDPQSSVEDVTTPDTIEETTAPETEPPTETAESPSEETKPTTAPTEEAQAETKPAATEPSTEPTEEPQNAMMFSASPASDDDSGSSGSEVGEGGDGSGNTAGDGSSNMIAVGVTMQVVYYRYDDCYNRYNSHGSVINTVQTGKAIPWNDTGKDKGETMTTVFDTFTITPHTFVVKARWDSYPYVYHFPYENLASDGCTFTWTGFTSFWFNYENPGGSASTYPRIVRNEESGSKAIEDYLAQIILGSNYGAWDKLDIAKGETVATDSSLYAATLKYLGASDKAIQNYLDSYHGKLSVSQNGDTLIPTIIWSYVAAENLGGTNRIYTIGDVASTASTNKNWLDTTYTSAANCNSGYGACSWMEKSEDTMICKLMLGGKHSSNHGSTIWKEGGSDKLFGTGLVNRIQTEVDSTAENGTNTFYYLRGYWTPYGKGTGGISLTKTNTAGTVNLAGAEFTLYRDPACTTPVTSADYSSLSTSDTGYVSASVRKTDANGKCQWTGLYSGTYFMLETKAPEGYKVNVDSSGKVIVKEVPVGIKTTDITLTNAENSKPVSLKKSINASQSCIDQIKDNPLYSLAGAEYNQQIWAEKQSGLCDPWAYEQPSFTLGEYGLEDEIFGVISIPALDLEMPLYLGASNQHMADGAAHLSQTSIPIGGDNTNAVIAGHRGWGGAAYFRYITELKPGDEVIITNLWGTLTYRVADTQIIWPHEVDQILIQEGRDLLTLLTCHPYASGGKQRYLVICERAE